MITRGLPRGKASPWHWWVRLRAASLLFVAVSLNMEHMLRIRTLPVVLARV